MLRSLEKTDIECILEYYNEWSVRKWTGVPLPKSRQDIEEWLDKTTKLDPWKDEALYFAITDKKTNQFLGIARLYDIRKPHHRASIGISIHDPEERSKGYGTDATLVILWVGFHILGLHSIYLDTMEDNERAIHTAQKVGFKKIGVFRETEFIRGEYKGLLYMDILRDEFMERYPPGTTIETENDV